MAWNEKARNHAWVYKIQFCNNLSFQTNKRTNPASQSQKCDGGLISFTVALYDIVETGSIQMQ